MHEIGIVQNLIKHASQAAGGRPIRRVHVTLGALADLSPEALEFYFEQLRPGTALADSQLVVRQEPGRMQCGACGHIAETELTAGVCPACGSSAARVIGGERIQLEAVEVE